MATAAPISLVTGAGRGIGRETARQLAVLGHTVLLCARRQEDAERAVADLAVEGPGRTVPYRLDVTDAEGARSPARRVEADFGRLDVLVNNAAVAYDTGRRAVSVDLDEVRRTPETNLFGAWHTAQAFLPLLRRSAHARVVNVSSGSGSLEHMTGGGPVERGAAGAVWAATLPDSGPTGGFFRDGEPPAW
ncbi:MULTISPECIES: SDR family NAD(P)-dependent oxidoreductase [unclassified Streptomyces]|uniref:SDR family NAD(P)-dependent oxidoreductase n=1 Tax=unclassified Streptomyces TaxID=2593676 RepID=UPI003688C012